MEFIIYVQENCQFCDELIIPEGITAKKVFIDKDDFVGFRPSQVPVIQTKQLQLQGPYQINEFLNIVKDAKDGKY